MLRQKSSDLERTIQPEIKHDEFYYAIEHVSCFADINTVLEIGSSAGAGSTEAFVNGLRHNANQPALFCLEVSKVRFEKLAERYRQDKFVKCYNASSVPAIAFPTREQVTLFYRTVHSALNEHPLEKVLGWLDQDIEYIRNSGVEQNGIELIKVANGIKTVDAVLIDGSEFSGESELNATYGAKIILLDDINGFKNAANHDRLKTDPAYQLLMENCSLRNGFSIFKRVDFPFIMDLTRPLPFATDGAAAIALGRATRKLRRLVSHFT